MSPSGARRSPLPITSSVSTIGTPRQYAAQVRPEQLEIERVRLRRVDPVLTALRRRRTEAHEVLTPRDARRGIGQDVERTAEQHQRRDAHAAQDPPRRIEVTERHARDPRIPEELQHLAERDRLQRLAASALPCNASVQPPGLLSEISVNGELRNGELRNGDCAAATRAAA